MNLFVYSHADEYLTRALLEGLGARADWRCLNTDEFVRRVEFEETLCQTQVDRRWTLDGEVLFSRDRDRFVDRVFSCAPSDGLFRDRHFANLEMDALFFYLRQNGPRHVSTLLHLEPRDWKPPLTSQWAHVSLATPRFEYPYRAESSTLDPDRLVIVDFNEQQRWRIGRHTDHLRPLAFERPPGRPLSILATPHAYLGATEVTNEAGRLAMSLCARFRAWFLEIVLFEDDGRYTFALASAQPSMAFAPERVREFLEKELV